MTATQARAKKGGEIGANGEFYEGGKFIAKTEKPKSQAAVSKKASKIEIEPRTWIESTSESIYTQIKWDVKIANGIASTHSMSFIDSEGNSFTADEIANKMELIEKYNRGERLLP